jgi:hypothetical protein
VLAGLAAGVPLLPTADEPPQHLTCALDLGVLLAGCSATSPHTIHPGADLSALAALAREAGLRFGPPLSDVMEEGQT